MFCLLGVLACRRNLRNFISVEKENLVTREVEMCLCCFNYHLVFLNFLETFTVITTNNSKSGA